jgi:pimeloyl-ACP methyl ester carboxylesterase
MGFDFSSKGHATRIVRLMDSLGIAQAGILGHDLGGRVAQEIAVGWPTRASRLCLVNSASLGDPPPFVARSATLVAPLLPYFPVRAVVRALARRLMRGYSDRSIGAHSIEQYLRPFLSAQGLTVLSEQLRALWNTTSNNVRRESRDITVPTAIVLGEDDPFLPRSTAARLQASIPSATLDYIPGARHFIPEETPEQLSRIVVSLMQR